MRIEPTRLLGWVRNLVLQKEYDDARKLVARPSRRRIGRVAKPIRTFPPLLKEDHEK